MHGQNHIKFLLYYYSWCGIPKECTLQMRSSDMFVYFISLFLLFIFHKGLMIDWFLRNMSPVSPKENVCCVWRKNWRFFLRPLFTQLRGSTNSGRQVAVTNKSCTYCDAQYSEICGVGHLSQLDKLWCNRQIPMAVHTVHGHYSVTGHLLFSWMLATVSHVVATLSVWVQRNSWKRKHCT